MSDAMAVFQPEAMGGLMKAAEQLSRSTLIPRALHGKPGDVLVVLLTGREFGLAPMQALRGIHVIDGKPVMAADLMVGLCLARKELCEYFSLVETTPRRATYKTKRVGQQETVLSWTWEQATAAKVTTKDNWSKYPDAMLRARCASALARAVYPDLLAGTYDPEELEPTPPQSKEKEAVRESGRRAVHAPAIEVLPPEQPAKPTPAPREPVDVQTAAAVDDPQSPAAHAIEASDLIGFGKHKTLKRAEARTYQLEEALVEGKETLRRWPNAHNAPGVQRAFEKPADKSLSKESAAKAAEVAKALGGDVQSAMSADDIAALVVAEAEVVEKGEDFGRLVAKAKLLPNGTAPKKKAAAALKAAAKRLGIGEQPARQPGEEG